MYNHSHQGRDNILSSRTQFQQEKHLFLLGGSTQGDSGLVLSTDVKPRLKWTAELHERFVDAVNQLGGPDKATPKTVMKIMGIRGLTLYHLKSHLQKYRLSKNLQAQVNSGGIKSVVGCVLPTEKRVTETNGSFLANTSTMPQTNKTMQINEAIQMQIEVQRRLHEQLEVQRHLQLRIEAQGKYLQSVLEKAQETLGKQNLGSSGIEAAKAQLSELVSKVSNECFSNAFSGVEEFPVMNALQAHLSQHTDCSLDSCLTSSEGSQKEREMHNLSRNFDIYSGKFIQQAQPIWYDDQNEHNAFCSPMLRNLERTSCDIQLSSDIMPTTNVKNESEKETVSGFRRKERNESISVEEANRKRQSNSFGLPCHSTQLDLNANDEDEVGIDCKQFDLNGFSWS